MTAKFVVSSAIPAKTNVNPPSSSAIASQRWWRVVSLAILLCSWFVMSAVIFAATPLAAQSTSQWIQLNPTGAVSPVVFAISPAIVSDPTTGSLILFGGASSPTGPQTNAVWLLTNANGLNTPQWVNLIPNGAAGSPPARTNLSAVYDPIGNRMIMFSGCLGGCTPLGSDVWVLSNANGTGGTPTWTRLFPTGGAPAPRSGFVAAYDPASNRMIIFGGQNGGGHVTGSTYSDTWVLTNANGLGGTPAWIQLSPSGGPPPGQYEAGAVYDAQNNRFIVTGGRVTDEASSNAAWVLSNANGLGGTPVWTNLIPEGAAGSPPASLARGGTAYDAVTNRMMTLWYNATNNNSTWVLNNANGLGGAPSWTQLPDVPGTSFGVAFDSVSDRLTAVVQPTSGALNEVWTLSNASLRNGSGTLGTIAVVSPNGGDTWAAGTTHAIQWSSTGITGNVTLTLLRAGILVQTITTVPVANNSYSWILPATLPVALFDYQIEVASSTDAAILGLSYSFSVSGVPAPATVSVTPSSGTGTSQLFQLGYADPTGFASITQTQTIFSAAQSYGTSCAFLYTASTGSIQMKDDAGLNWSLPGTLGVAGLLQNSQCSIDVGASSAAGAGNNLTLNLAVTFKPTYVGTKNVYMLATNKYGLNSGWSVRGTWTLQGTPSTVSVTPSSGTGSSQLFQLKYADPTGFASITMTQTIFSAVQTYGTSCAFLYTASTGSIQMKDDGGLNWSAAAKLGVAGALQNSQCSIDAGASSAVGSGNNLTLNLAVTFKPAYVGIKNTYMLATNKYGFNSGWSQRGTWTLPGIPSAVSVTPSSGTGTTQLFQLKYSDPTGFDAITMAQTIFSAAQTYGNSCAFLYTASTGSIQMKDDSGLNWSAPAKLAVPGVLQNSQCSIDVGASGSMASGNNLTLSYAVTFKPSYAGTKNVYMNTVNKYGLNSGWSSHGTWNVPGNPPTIVSVLPSTGSGASQLFQLTYSDPGGFAAITMAQTIFSSARTYGNSCAFLYTASTGSIQMKDDSGANWSAAAKLGVTGVLQNSQCSLDAGASSAVGTGNNLTLNYAVTFKPGYAGAKSVYSLANNKFGLNSTWQTPSTWTVPAGAPSILSVMPNAGTGLTQLFQLTYSDPAGFAAVTLTQAIFGAAQSYGHSCAVLYTAANGSIQIKDDSGLNWSSSAKLGIAGVLANSQCSIDAGSSSGVGSGNNLTVKLAVTFKSTYTGTKNIYSLANNKFSLNSGWQILGTWAVPGPLAITTTSLANATIGTAYSKTLSTTGGTAPISWSVTTGTLPSWLTLHSTTGVLDGTPTGAPTTTNFTVKATDAGSPSQTKTQALSITTISALPIGVTVIPSTVTIGINTAFPFSVTVTNTSNTAVTWSIQEGATGGTINAFGSYMSPGHSGTYHVIATSVADPTKSGMATVTVKVANPIFNSIPPIAASEGILYNYPVSATDPAGTFVTLTLTEAPAGATISTDLLRWTPSSAQSRTPNTFVVTATTAAGGYAQQQWSVNPAGTIRGSRIITYVADSGPVDQPYDVSTFAIAAYVPNGTGFTKLVGTGSANGTFTIPNVPAGYYWLQFTGNYFWTTTSTIDTGYNQQGRPGVLPGGNGTINFNLSSSTIWQPSDNLEVYSSNANSGSITAPPQSAWGKTTLIDSYQWSDVSIDATQGDRTYVAQLSARGPSGMVALTNVAGPFAINIGTGTASVTGPLQPISNSSIRVNLKGSTIAAITQGLHPAAIPQLPLFYLDAQPGGPSRGFIGWTPDLVMYSPQQALSTDTDLGDVSYGNPYPANWTPFVVLQTNSYVSYLSPGATQSTRLYSFASSNSNVLPTSSSAFGLLVGPPSSPTIDGSSFFNDHSAASLTPTVSWQPPLFGSVHGYRLIISRLYAGANGVSQFSGVATLYTKQTSLTIPPDVLSPGSSYVFRITSVDNPNNDIELQPYKYGFPYAFAQTSSGIYTTAGTAYNVKILNPNGGEVWHAGTAHNIQWSYSGLPGNVTLSLMKAGVVFRPIANLPGNAGMFTWTVPSDVPTTSDYQIYITADNDGLIADASDLYFAITSSTFNPLTITTVSLPGGAVNAPYTTTLAYSGGTPSVSWSVSSGMLPPGLTLNNVSGVISGTPTAPGTVYFSVRATDHSLPPQTPEVALSITINSAPLVIVTNSLPNAAIGVPYTASLQFNGGTPPISWSVIAGSLPSGLTLHSATGVIDGTPTGTLTTATFTVRATDSGSPTQSNTRALSITTVAGGVNNAELNGHYAFTLRGFDSVGSTFVTRMGSFAADGNGHITGGVEDINEAIAGGIHTNLSITGIYWVGADQRGTMTFTTAQGTSTFAFALGQISSGNAALGRIIETDAKVLTGTFKKQDTSAFHTTSLIGNFAFGLGGFGGTGRVAAAGVMSMDGAGNFSSVIDSNDGGKMNPDTSIGNYSVSDTVNGRGTFNDTTNGSHVAMYVVSASEVFFINIDPFTTYGPSVFTGAAEKQPGTFTNASMNGTSVFMAQSVSNYSGGIPASAYTGIGLFTFNGTGGLTVVMDENDGGVVSQISASGNYNVASNGRMTMTINGMGTVPEVFYLIKPGKAFSVGTDGAVSEGALKPQDLSGAPFSNASLSGNFIFGTEPTVMNNNSVEVGVANMDGAGNVTGTSDENQWPGSATSNSFTDTCAVSPNGRVVLGQNIMYIIAPSKAVMMSSRPGDTHSKLQMLDK